VLGELDAAAIEELLQTGTTGRIGCHAQGRTYVVPITYAYQSGSVYGHSSEGLKIRMMRENPQVCFQVDRVRGAADWESVIAWGEFEELTGARAIEAFNLLTRQASLPADSNVHPSYVLRGSGPLPRSQDGRAILIYRIALAEKTGRFERR
jgi:nitroimidazol reductase NimA-like FMN-containing flavoprotein (pyridoxamine 5'-phosphate oxidase superfamily)